MTPIDQAERKGDETQEYGDEAWLLKGSNACPPGGIDDSNEPKTESQAPPESEDDTQNNPGTTQDYASTGSYPSTGPSQRSVSSRDIPLRLA